MAAAACREPAADGLTFEVSDPVSPVVAVVCHNDVREFMAESAHVLDPEGRGIDDLYPKLVAEMKYIVANFSDDKVRQALLHHIAVPYIDSFGIDDIEEMSGIYKKYVTDPARTAEFDAAYWKWFNKGKKPAL